MNTTDVLIPLKECAELVHSPSITAYRKRYLKSNTTGHPAAVSLRPMLFRRDEWQSWFKRNFETKL